MVYHPHLEVYYDARLREKSGGVYEGAPLGTTNKLAEESGLPMREYRPEGGESWEDVEQRVRAFTDALFTTFVLTPSPVLAKVLVVSHRGWMSEFVRVLKEFSDGELLQMNSSNSALSILRVTEVEGRPRVEVVLDNDVSHLDS
jgi:broad specificity phosphatase PhoE